MGPLWLTQPALRQTQPAQRVEWTSSYTHELNRSESGTYYDWNFGTQWTATPQSVQNLGAPQPRTSTGEEWWFGHSNGLDNGVTVGVITAGHASWPNCYWKGSGCSLSLADEIGTSTTSFSPRPDELEKPDHRKGETRGMVSRLDLEGELIWSRKLLPGQLFNAIQTSDGGFVATGITYSNVWPPDMGPADGKILTINNGATIRFADSEQLYWPTRIVVAPGGVLNVVDATLSSLDQCPNSMWDGIVLQGDASADQGSGTVGLDQAYLNVTNATIENARTAVVVANAFQMGSLSDVPNELRSGGIVRTVDASFHNNIYDVSFSPYENHINSAVANNRSNFIRTKFETVGLLADPAKDPVSHATLSLVRGILFSGCTFSNDLSGQLFYGYEDRGWGIHSISSSFRVQAHCNVPLTFGEPCAEANLVRSRFQGLHRGIRATTMDLSRTFSVSKAIFTDVHLGIRMDGIQDAAITETSFSIPRALHDDAITTTYGIYSEQCTGYRIESNSFASMDGNPEPRRAGLAIRNSGENYNTFYNNSFDGLKLGSVIQGKNANDKYDTGLEVKCNDYGQSIKNTFDVALTSYDATIRGNQGLPPDPTDPQPDTPAGNRFSAHNEADHPESDWYADASNFVEYYYHIPTAGNRTRPDYNDASLNPAQTPVTWPGKTTACPTAFSRPKAQLREASGLAQEGLEDVTAEYDATKDDGDTYSLLAYVADPGNNSLEVRNALQSVAPKVSTEVWQAAFERSSVMQPWHITQALLSNSPL